MKHSWRLALPAVLLLMFSLAACQVHTVVRRSIDLHDTSIHKSDFYLPRRVIPSGYRLELYVNPDMGMYAGTSFIIVKCEENTNEITLHAHENLTIVNEKVMLIQIPFNATFHSLETAQENNRRQRYNQLSVINFKKDVGKQWYTITLSRTLEWRTMYLLTIPFTGKLNTDREAGFFRQSYYEYEDGERVNKWYAATDMKSTKAHHVFPCFDEPAYKVPFELRVAAHSKYWVLSSMPERDLIDVEGRPNWLWHIFKTSPLLSTFSIGVALVNLKKKELRPRKTKRKLYLFAQPSIFNKLYKVENLTIDYIEFMEEYLDFQLPPEELNILILPKYRSEVPASHWGLVYISQENVTHNETYFNMTRNSVASRKIMETLTTQWFEHLCTPFWWSDTPFTLNVIKFLSRVYLTKKNIFGSYDFINYFNMFEKNVTEREDATQENNAHRAIWVLHMFNNTVSDDTFRRGLNKFLVTRQLTTFKEENFWHDMKEVAVYEGKLDAHFDIHAFVKSWTDEEHFPIVTVLRNYPERTAIVEQHVYVEDDPYHDFDTRSVLFYIPIMYIFQNNMEIDLVKKVKWMRNQKEIMLYHLPDAKNFIIVNPEEIGLFIVNYDLTNWDLIQKYLLESAERNMTQIPPRTRAKLLSDALNLALAGELPFNHALSMTLFLRREYEYIVWENFLQIADYINIRIDGTSAGNGFREYCGILLKRFLSFMGERHYNESHYTTELRNNAHSMYIKLTDHVFKRKHYPIVRKWMSDGEINYWSETTCQVLRWGNDPEFNYVTRKIFSKITGYHKPDNVTLLYQMLTSCSYHKEHVKRILETLLLDQNEHFLEEGLLKSVEMLWSYAGGHQALFEILNEHWSTIRRRFQEKTVLWKAIVKNALLFNSQESFNKAAQFYNAKMNEFGSADVIARKSMVKMKRLSDWTAKYLPEMEVWLHQHLSTKDYFYNI